LILNFYLIHVTVLTTLLHFLLIYINNYTLSEYSVIGDSISRIFINDFFINSYYLLWTSFWYLPTFLCCIFGIFYLNFSRSQLNLLCTPLMSVCIVFCAYHIDINPYTHLITIDGSNFNPLLSNSVNKFHPALFYWTLTLLPTLSNLLKTSISRTYYFNATLINSITTSRTYVCIIVYTLFLGSWWALQEGSWGGWWNWDASEVFGLWIMLFYLYRLHRNYSTSEYVVTRLRSILFVKSIIITYLFIQLNFDLVSHNFGTKVDQFIDTTQNLIVTLLLITLSFISTTRLTQRINIIPTLWGESSKQRMSCTGSVWYSVLILTILFIVGSSYALLLNDFTWKLLQVNVFNSVRFTYFYSSLILTVVLIRCWYIHLIPFYLTAYIFYFTKELPLAFITSTSSNVNMLHTVLISLLLNMLTESNHNLNFWSLITNSVSVGQDFFLYDIGNMVVSLNNFFIEYSLGLTVNNVLIESVWNFITNTSTVENHSFHHLTTTDFTSQMLYTGSTVFRFMINVVDSSVSTTFIIFTLILIYASLLFNKNNIIKF